MILRHGLLVAAVLLASTWGGSARAERDGFYQVASAGLADDYTCIGISHRNPNLVFVGTSTGKILRTDDGGATWQETLVTPARSLFFGRERQSDSRLEYALGLPGKSPHLQSWLRQKGLHTSGINLQQLLVKKGDKQVAVNWIEVSWHDENLIYVGTVDGLYRSVDGGRTYLRIWQGRSGMRERIINTVVTDPAVPGRLMVGTASGLFYSKDGGASFRKEMDFYIRDSYIRGMWFDRTQKGLVHMAMGGASMASPDAGKNWITTYWHLWGPRGSVHWLSLGPGNLRLMGTEDGLFASLQGGEMGSWKRRGIRFVKQTIDKVQATKDPRIWYATTEIGLWKTYDQGLSWRRVIELGGKEQPRWVEAWANDPNQMWFITNRAIYRRGVILKMRAQSAAPRRRRLLDVPSLHTFWKHVMRHHHHYFADIQRYKDRAPWASLLPEVIVSGYWSPTRDVALIKSFPWFQYPYTYFNQRIDRELSLEVLAMWDFTRLVFDRRALPHFGRIERNLNAHRLELGDRMRKLYREYILVARTLAFSPPQDPITRQFLRIRIQEITAYFDAISSGYWSKKSKGGLR
ncbi:MAG: hypothetical protein KC503_14820 [Myxococcales bacterium]|nr:hypothetical protein [Myxococcales bacterium]